MSPQLKQSVEGIREYVRTATPNEIVMSLIDLATERAAERERCAEIAEDADPGETGSAIARHIREGE